MKIKTNEKQNKTVSQKKKKNKTTTHTKKKPHKYHCFVLANLFWVWNKVVAITRVHFYKNAVEFSIYICTCVLMWIYLDT